MRDILFRGKCKDNGEWIEVAGALFEFSESEDDIPSAEKRLLESYGIKENDNESGNN